MRTPASVALVLLLFLPNFLFLIPLPVYASMSATLQQPMGQPLPPGSVSYQNSWNATQACPSTAIRREPLLPTSNGWTVNLVIPSTSFRGTRGVGNLTQHYSLSQDGTFSVSDNAGNSFSLSVPASQFGIVTAMKLLANSTAAFETIQAGVSPLSAANVSLSFSVYNQYCQPAGVRLEIHGAVNWGFAGRGKVKIVFNKVPASVSGYRAWFGSVATQSLGFDWSDSKSLSPTFDVKTSTLVYDVGSDFSIDPVTVGTSTSSVATQYDTQTRMCMGNNKDWIFYFDGSNYVYRSSGDALVWTSASSISTAGLKLAGDMGIACSGSAVYRAILGASSGSNKGWYFDTGTLNMGGTITWNTEVQVESSDIANGNTGPSVAVDTSGKVWVAFSSSTNGRLEIWKCSSSCLTVSNWSDNRDVLSQSCVQLIALTYGKLAAVFTGVDCSSAGHSRLGVETFDGTSSWSTEIDSTKNDYVLSGGSFAAVQDTIQGWVARSSSGCYNPSFVYGSSGWTESPNPYGLGRYCSMSTDGGANLVAFDADGTSTVEYWNSKDSGSTWNSFTIGSSASSPTWVGNLPVFGSMPIAMWTEGTSSPYNVRLYAFPLTIPVASLSSNSWSKPGISPYESYLSGMTDYVSPGNGLLSVEQSVVSLSGRGMDLGVSLVFSTPYAFKSGTPYLYDNSSYSSGKLGYGWSLNFPWMGADYLHLADGQAYPYAYSGNTFEYHRTTDFKLVNSGSSGYSLFLSSGTVYYFDSSQKLTSVQDRIGNTISFNYANPNCLSCLTSITDTIGRSVTFSYNANFRISTISEGGISWTIGYTGSQLTSVTDPLSRVTTYGYVGTTGANAWLISSINYPSQGKVIFAYGSAAVGTEVNTEYVTSKTTYYDSTHVSQSDSTSYYIFNGNAVWANTTVSDGVNTRSITNENFQGSKNSMMIYSEDQTGAVKLVSEQDSDSAGRTNKTKTMSPGGSLLSYSLMTYDSWGNAKYSKDRVGHETWFSFANADSYNSFGSSGCTASFYTQSVPSNIHNAIVGSCAYQNGSGTPQLQTYYKYDSSGNLGETKQLHNSRWLLTDYTYDSFGNRLSTTDANSHVTYFRYSSTYSAAYLTKTSILVGTQNVTSTYTWNLTFGFKMSETNPLGATTSYKYDNLGRLKLTTFPAIGGVSKTKSYTYDDTNNVLTLTDENLHIVKQYFDGLGRMTKLERWNGTSVYSAETYTYTWLNTIATKTTAAGNTYTYSYDFNGRESKLTNPDTTYSTTTYDDINNLKTATDENGHQTVYAYDWNQRLSSVKEYNSSSNYYLTSYSYDLSGNLLSTTDAKNQATIYQYDDLNRLTQTTFPDSKYETRTYDNIGNLLTRTTANSSLIQYQYDALNRLTTVTYPGTGNTVTYSYDAGSNRIKLVNPSATDKYAYDARGRLTNQTEVVGGTQYTTLYTYDGVGNVLSIQYPDSYAVQMTYDVANRLLTMGSFATMRYTLDDKMNTITYGDGETATYTYDNRDRPKRILDKYGVTKELDLNYTYDGVGNVLTENTESYGYDYLNRLTSSTGSWGTISYTYDQVGNRVKMVQGSTTTNYCYGNYNRLNGYYTSTSCSSPAVSYTYDPNGNMITRNNGTAWAYSYDYENRLTKVVKAGAAVQQNYYDADGNRIKKTETHTTAYSYQGLNTIYEKDVTSGTITKHFYAGGLQVAKMVGSSTYYLHADHLGSTRLVMSSSLSIVFSSNYVPYGPGYGSSGSEVFRYTGKPFDTVTGMYYEGARFYDPVIGRFVTQDSVSGAQEYPQSLNRYEYARNNPMRIIDPDGHWGLDFSSITSGLSSLASGLSSAVSSANSAVSNWWGSLPPAAQDAVIVTVAVVATAATVGLAAPVIGSVAVGALASVGVTAGSTAVAGVVASAAAGAGLGAVGSLATGLYNGNASPDRVLAGAAIGVASGAAGAVGGFFANVGIGVAATFANQQADAYLGTGHWAAITPKSVLGDALGGLFAGGGKAGGEYIGERFGSAWGENTFRNALITTGTQTGVSTWTQINTPITMTVKMVAW